MLGFTRQITIFVAVIMLALAPRAARAAQAPELPPADNLAQLCVDVGALAEGLGPRCGEPLEQLEHAIGRVRSHPQWTTSDAGCMEHMRYALLVAARAELSCDGGDEPVAAALIEFAILDADGQPFDHEYLSIFGRDFENFYYQCFAEYLERTQVADAGEPEPVVEPPNPVTSVGQPPGTGEPTVAGDPDTSDDETGGDETGDETGGDETGDKLDKDNVDKPVKLPPKPSEPRPSEPKPPEPEPPKLCPRDGAADCPYERMRRFRILGNVGLSLAAVAALAVGFGLSTHAITHGVRNEYSINNDTITGLHNASGPVTVTAAVIGGVFLISGVAFRVVSRKEMKSFEMNFAGLSVSGRF